MVEQGITGQMMQPGVVADGVRVTVRLGLVSGRLKSEKSDSGKWVWETESTFVSTYHLPLLLITGVAEKPTGSGPAGGTDGGPFKGATRLVTYYTTHGGSRQAAGCDSSLSVGPCGLSAIG